MMRRIRLILAISMMLYLAVLTLRFPALAQTAAAEASRIEELERRANQAEGEHTSERLARMEATMETNNKLLIAVFGAVVLMLLERAARAKPGSRRTESRE